MPDEMLGDFREGGVFPMFKPGTAPPQEFRVYGSVSKEPMGRIMTRKDCGCTVIGLAQGVALLPCAKHQQGVLAAIEPTVLLPDGTALPPYPNYQFSGGIETPDATRIRLSAGGVSSLDIT